MYITKQNFNIFFYFINRNIIIGILNVIEQTIRFLLYETVDSFLFIRRETTNNVDFNFNK